MDRREAVEVLLANRRDLVVVTGLGSPAYDAFAAGDHDRNLYLWGAMGGAIPLGLGLALARRDVPVLVLTGDGEALMGLGALATAGAKRPANLTIAVLDNGHYGETGMQASHTAMGADLAGVAKAVGFAWTETVSALAGIEAVRPHLEARQGLGFLRLVVAAGEPPRALPPRDGHRLKHRLRVALGQDAT
ncbi:MAG: aldehyde dehydrogenase [Geminicoccaceae bacterium]|nr:MAG: aldehyde dehydrogenase [Geminicoccaceae bacterium]